MKGLKKILAFVAAAAMILSSLPLSFAVTEKDVENIVQSDYQAYTETNNVTDDNLTAGTDYEKDEIIFDLETGKNRAYSISSVAEEYGLTDIEVIDESALTQNVSLFSGGDSKTTVCKASFDSSEISVFEMCKIMNANDSIENCEPNYIYYPTETDSDFVMPTEISSSSVYDSSQKWYFENGMNIPSAWQKYGNLGDNVTVAVIDTGLNYNHNEIKDQLWNDGNGNHGYNAEFGNNDIYGTKFAELDEGPRHGSHCAGIIAMQPNNGGLVGVAPNAKIMVCCAVSSVGGGFSHANLIKSLNYAVENGADVISMSLGGYTFGFHFQQALARSSMHAVILCAAGNDGYNTDTMLHFPSASSAVIGVMALGSGSSSDTLSSYSNYDLTGRFYEVAAPGTNIYSIDSRNNTGYVSMSGTSMATPFAAGIAALYVAQHPELTPSEAKAGIISASGTMVKGYVSKTDAQSNSFKKMSASNILDYTPVAAENIVINNDTIDQAVRTALNVDENYQLTNYDIANVTYIDLSNTDFSDYAAIAQLPNLAYIDLSNTNMNDSDAQELAAYAGNKVLYLDLSQNELTNLSFLYEFKGCLHRLNVSDNQINNISGIETQTAITILDISENKIKSIAPCSSITGLTVFYAPGNLIEDPTPILNLKYIEEIYFGSYNPDVSDIFGEFYFVSGNGGNKISSLVPFTEINGNSSRIHYLNLSNNYINKDSSFNFNISTIKSVLNTISTKKYNAAGYKFIYAPCAQSAEDLIPASDYSVEDKTVSRSESNFKLYAVFAPAEANYYTSINWISDSGIVRSDGTVTFNPLDIDGTKSFIVTAQPDSASSMQAKQIILSVTAPEIYSAVTADGKIEVKTNIYTDKIKLNETEYTEYTEDSGYRVWIINSSDTEGQVFAGDSCGYSENAFIAIGTDSLSGRAKVISASAVTTSVSAGDKVIFDVETSSATDSVIIQDQDGNELSTVSYIKTADGTKKEWTVTAVWECTDYSTHIVTVYAAANGVVSTASAYRRTVALAVNIPAEKIVFTESGKTLYLNDSTYQIPYSFSPLGANSGLSIKWASKDTSIVSVTSSGKITVNGSGSTYVTATLPNGNVSSFFILVKDTYAVTASMLNTYSSYTAGKLYSAVVYTKNADTIKILDEQGNTLSIYRKETFQNSTDLTDENGETFCRWIVPITFTYTGKNTINIYAGNENVYSDVPVSFTVDVEEKTGYDLSGTVTSYNGKFDTHLTLFSDTDEVVQTITLKAIGSGVSYASNTAFKFTNIPEGNYKILIEKEGCESYWINNISLTDNTVIESGSGGGETGIYSLDDVVLRCGDVNGDNCVDINDASELLLEINFSRSTVSAENILCDINADGMIDVNDLAIMHQ